MPFSFILLQTRSAPQQDTTLGNIVLYGQFVLIALVFYFLIFRPKQKQAKQQQQMLNELKNGDAVVTTGGIVGTITALDRDTIVLRVKPDNLKLQFSRSAVSGMVPPEGSK